MKMNRVKTDILVIGGGMAGWMASAHVKEAGLDVIIVDKGFIGKAGQSPYASNLYAYDPAAGKSVDEVVSFVHHGGRD
ncbi:MAG: FAD-binding protein [Lachnospiraceae bacterium]|nr:FAD-binding protein [Lachnospiraceae bacterium]